MVPSDKAITREQFDEAVKAYFEELQLKYKEELIAPTFATIEILNRRIWGERRPRPK